jgi:hypothetical protein
MLAMLLAEPASSPASVLAFFGGGVSLLLRFGINDFDEEASSVASGGKYIPSTSLYPAGGMITWSRRRAGVCV